MILFYKVLDNSRIPSIPVGSILAQSYYDSPAKCLVLLGNAKLPSKTTNIQGYEMSNVIYGHYQLIAKHISLGIYKSVMIPLIPHLPTSKMFPYFCTNIRKEVCEDLNIQYKLC